MCLGVPAFCFFVAVRWKYFISALARDQDKLKSVAAAPAKSPRHEASQGNAVSHRAEQDCREGPCILHAQVHAMRVGGEAGAGPGKDQRVPCLCGALAGTEKVCKSCCFGFQC